MVGVAGRRVGGSVVDCNGGMAMRLHGRGSVGPGGNSGAHGGEARRRRRRRRGLTEPSLFGHAISVVIQRATNGGMLHGEDGLGPREPGAAATVEPLIRRLMTAQVTRRGRARTAALRRPKRRSAPSNSGTVLRVVAARPKRLQTVLNPPSNWLRRFAHRAFPAANPRHVAIRRGGGRPVVAEGLVDGREEREAPADALVRQIHPRRRQLPW